MQTMDEKSLYSGVTVIILTKEDVKKSLRDILNNLTDSQKNQPFIKISILEPEEVDIDNVDSSKFENQQVYTKQLQKMEGKAVGKLITKGSKEGDFETFRKKFENIESIHAFTDRLICTVADIWYEILP